MSDKVIPLPELSVGDINGTVKTSGLETEGKITEIPVTDSWVALPSTALVDRNAMTIQNQGGSDVKLGYLGAGGYVGVLVASLSERFYNITDGITIYARCDTGESTTLVIEELS